MFELLSLLFVYGICAPLVAVLFLAALADLYRNR